MAHLNNAPILVVDDEHRIADTLAAILRQAGYVVMAFYSGEDLLTYITGCQPSLIISDVVMPGINGIEVAKKVRSFYPNCPVLLFSGNLDTQQMLDEAGQQGHSFEILAKPVPPPQMLAMVASLLDRDASACDHAGS